MLDITNFNSLLTAAKLQEQPQKFLIAFLEVSLPHHHQVKQAKDYLAGIGGILNPIGLIEKDPNHLDDLSSLAKESLAKSTNWKIALVGCLSGANGSPPDIQITNKHKESMIQNILAGSHLSKYIAFHKNGDILQFA